MRTMTQFQRVKKFTLEQVKLAIASGKQLVPGAWAYPGDNYAPTAKCCAVGALAYNGEKLSDDSNDKIFVVAPNVLKQLGVPSEEIGFILDAISDGFEQDFLRPDYSTRHFRNSLIDSYALPKKYLPYWRLGNNIRRRYYLKHWGVRF